VDEHSAWAIRETGERVLLSSLGELERVQVYLSLMLAVVAAAARKGVQLPLILDEPFACLDERTMPALAAVLDALSHEGHQILVFTGCREAIVRLASLGACIHDLVGLRRWRRQPSHISTTDSQADHVRVPSFDTATVQSVTATAPSGNPPMSAGRGIKARRNERARHNRRPVKRGDAA
jgi:hypothetical protein